MKNTTGEKPDQLCFLRLFLIAARSAGWSHEMDHTDDASVVKTFEHRFD